MNLHRILMVALLALSVASCGKREDSTTKADSEPKAATDASAHNEAEHNEDGEEKAGSVELSPEAQRRLGVVVTQANEAELAVPLQVTGTVQPLDTRMSHVRPLARGRVTNVLVKVGDRVANGQSLATFDNIEAGELASQHLTARAELARLRVQLATSTRQVERSRKLLDLGAIPQKEHEANVSEQQQLEEAIRAQESTVAGMATRLRRFGLEEATSSDGASVTTIRAPFAGVVTKVEAAPGEVVDSSTELFAVADISQVYVQAQVYEKDLGRIRAGQSAVITVDAYPDERFVGRIVAIADVIDPQTRTAAVRCAVANPQARLKLDMFATVNLPTTASEKALAVPTDAVQTIEGKTVVFVQGPASTFVAREIQSGQTTATFTAITRGLKAGESVVTKGAFQVKSALLAKGLAEEGEEHD